MNVGCIPSKSLLNNSHLYHVATHEFPKRGIRADNISLDLPAMLAAKEKSVSGLTSGIEFLFKKNKVDWIKGWYSLLSLYFYLLVLFISYLYIQSTIFSLYLLSLNLQSFLFFIQSNIPLSTILSLLLQSNIPLRTI